MQYLQIILSFNIDTKLTEILLKEHAQMFNINTDKYQMGIQRFIEEETLDELFQFIALYVQRIYPDAHLRKNMKRFVNKTFLEMITTSDIVYVLALIKNSQGVWDQDMRVAANPHVLGGKEKLHPLFTSGKGKRRIFGKCVRTREGLEYFYMAEMNWKKVYRTKSIISRFATEWEHWTPDDSKLKDSIRTHWLEDEEINEFENRTAKKSVEEKEWLDKDGEEGYNSEYDHIDWDWDNTVKGKEVGDLDNDEGNQSDGDGNQLDGKKEKGEEDQGDGGDPKKEQCGKKIGKGREEKKMKLPSQTSGRSKK
jgi:hypothetical protein